VLEQLPLAALSILDGGVHGVLFGTDKTQKKQQQHVKMVMAPVMGIGTTITGTRTHQHHWLRTICIRSTANTNNQLPQQQQPVSLSGAYYRWGQYDDARQRWGAATVKLLPLPHPPVRARTDARTNPSAQRATQLRSVLARVHAISIQNQITTTVP
jgi:hypothetical protein